MASPSSDARHLAVRVALLLRASLAITVVIVAAGLAVRLLRGGDGWLHVAGVVLLVATPFLATLMVAVSAARTHPRLTLFAVATLLLVALGVWLA